MPNKPEAAAPQGETAPATTLEHPEQAAPLKSPPPEVRIPLLPQSRSNLRRHHYRRHREDRETQADLLPLFIAARPAEPLTACRLEVLLNFPDRQHRDLDNYLSGLKPWLDAAVDAGLLAEDRWECLHTITASARLRRGRSETLLRFHPEPPPDLCHRKKDKRNRRRSAGRNNRNR